MTNTLTHTHTDDRSELLSDYLDNALDVAARQQAERTVRDCAACADELADLRSLQAMLRALPTPVPRRSFTIDPATVRPRRLLFPIFRIASLAAAVMLFVVLGIDALPSNDPATMPTAAMMESRAGKEVGPAGGAAESGQYSDQATSEPPMAALSAPAPEGTMAAEAAADAAPSDDPAAAAGSSEAAETDQPIMPMGEGAQALTQSSAQPSAEAGSELANAPDTLRNSDNVASETTQLDASPTEVVAEPFDLWRTLAYVLAVFVIGLGGAWWWTARRGI